MSYKLDPKARYAKSDEWVRLENDVAVIGISDYAQNALSDVVYIELPAVGARFAQGDQCATVESVKAASDIYAPLSGVVIAVNQALESAPEMVNADPFGDAWFFQLKPDDASELDNLMTPEAYDAYCATRTH